MDRISTKHCKESNRRSERPVFDARDLADVPQADDHDQPYRSWWVGLGPLPANESDSSPD